MWHVYSKVPILTFSKHNKLPSGQIVWNEPDPITLIRTLMPVFVVTFPPWSATLGIWLHVYRSGLSTADKSKRSDDVSSLNVSFFLMMQIKKTTFTWYNLNILCIVSFFWVLFTPDAANRFFSFLKTTTIIFKLFYRDLLQQTNVKFSTVIKWKEDVRSFLRIFFNSGKRGAVTCIHAF